MDLLLFALADEVTAAAADAGIDALVVDLERRGKDVRQAGYDTGLSHQTLDDVGRVRRLSPLPLLVRVDGPGPGLDARVRQAAEACADEVLVPMVVDAAEVERCLLGAPGVRLSVLVERASAVADSPAIGRLPLERVYVGLTDLMVERGGRSPFDALVDGTVGRVRAAVPGSLGAGGLTLPGHGRPVPVELVAGELLRNQVDFTFLRRSFLRDLSGADALPQAIEGVRRMLEAARGRGPDQVAADHAALVATLAAGARA